MSAFDAQLQYFVFYLAVPLFVLFIVTQTLRNELKDQFYQFQASMINKFANYYKYNKKNMNKRKNALFSELHVLDDGLARPLRLVEIGVGTGQNFQYFPPGTDVVCVDPNPHFRQYLDVSLSRQPHVNLVEFVVGRAEDMGRVESSSVDVVVSTLVLCTVDDVDAVLTEVLRVLKPTGLFIFLEHVSADNKWRRALQYFLCPVWKCLIGGSFLNRETWTAIYECGFSAVKLEHFSFSLGLLTSLGPCIAGTATK